MTFAIGTTEGRGAIGLHLSHARSTYIPLARREKLSTDQFDKVTADWRMYARLFI